MGGDTKDHRITIREPQRNAAEVFDTAGNIAPGTRLRSLDAPHVPCAMVLGAALSAFVTYDKRLAEVASRFASGRRPVRLNRPSMRKGDTPVGSVPFSRRARAYTPSITVGMAAS